MQTLYSVTDYLLDRLAELGADRVFGVPGDFTLRLLDHIEDHPILSWVGCANELGAGYAADGYARVRGIAAVCTTFGVGELSAINAIAGSFAEHVPVLHVVGSPARATQAAARATHHTLGDGDFRHFARMSSEVTCAQAFLDPENAAAEIDRVLGDMLERRLPGYLSIPTDVGETSIDPPTAPLPGHAGVTDPAALERFTEAAAAILASAGSAAVLADILVQRMGAQDDLRRLLESAPLPYATLLWGRRVVDESGRRYLGAYAGAASPESVRMPIEGSDVLIMAGVQFTDLTSGFFSQHLQEARTIDVGPRGSTVAGERFEPLDMRDALVALTGLVASATLSATEPAEPTRAVLADTPEHRPPGGLSQAELWETVARALRPGDLVLADQGTSFYGLGPHHLPHDTVFIGQPLWASIGFTLPALLGAALAAPDRRPVLLIGDGAAQLTIAELGTLIRQQVPAVIVVVNNDGYTVERAIHGPTAGYNDIARWDWTALVPAMGGGSTARARTVRTAEELRQALDDAADGSGRLTLIEAIVPPLDVPPLLVAIAQAASAANARRE